MTLGRRWVVKVVEVKGGTGELQEVLEKHLNAGWTLQSHTTAVTHPATTTLMSCGLTHTLILVVEEKKK